MLAKKKQAGGAPEWALTYGDMMSLLLCFFILLAAFADYEEGGGSSASASVAQAMQSIQAALGIKVKDNTAFASAVDFNAMVEQIKETIKQLEAQHRGDTNTKGVQGKSFRLRRIRDGMEITVGGVVLFEPFVARVTPEGAQALESIAGILRGHRNKIDVVGHAAEQPRPADWTYTDSMQLSYDRARLVADELIRRGVDPRAVRLVAVGDNEPVGHNGLSREGENRRVEILVRESVLDDYRAEAAARGTPISSTGPIKPKPASTTGQTAATQPG